jgi:hypothetical protein
MGNEKPESKVRGALDAEWERLRKESPAIVDFVVGAVEQGFNLGAEAVKAATPTIDESLMRVYIELADEEAEEEDLLEFSQAEEDEKDDAINPNHYKAGNVECIEAIQESLTAEAFAGYLKGNVQKYLWRYETKHWEDPLQDLQKAEWYLGRLIALVGEDYE